MFKRMNIALLGLLLAVSFICTAQAGQAEIPLVINELMASNRSCISDPQGQYDDWIEIHNYGLDASDIGGMYLTDNPSDPTKWRIPTNNPAATTIPAGGYLLIWADGDTGDAGLQANFKLDADGEQIALFDSDGVTLIDSISFSSQTTDISYGRYPDAADNLCFFSDPSPGALNVSAYLGEVAEVEFSHKRGFYEMPFFVTIATETEDTVIYYTLDGSEPFDTDSGGRAPNGIVYTDPVLINKTSYLRAKAIKLGYRPSEVNTQTFIFLGDVLQQSRDPVGFPSSWGGTSADYEMDPDIVRDPRYSGMMKDALLSIPSMSLVMTNSDMFDSGNGIYANPNGHGASWERPGSMELIYPDGTDGMQVNCGIRIQGGAFRNWGLTKKKSFRLLFKGIYGPSKLRYSLFGEDAADQFDTIVLRAGANDGYAWSAARFTEQYTRDQFGRDLQRATGNAASHGMFVHLYVNGLYWGLYNPCERPDASFSASYYGGDKEDWDAIHDLSASNGDNAAWNQMISMCRQAASSDQAYWQLQGRNPDGTPNPAYPNLLDATNYVDYLIVNLWGGNWDWPWKNWWAGRDRTVNSTGFKFYCWDYENTMGNNLDRSPLNKNALQNNFSSAGVPHENLSRNAEYRMLFADRVHRFFFNDGILTPQSLTDRYMAMANQIEMAIVAESARWGDEHHSNPLTLEDWYDRDTNYNDGRAGRGWILNHYIPQRSDIVLQQFREAGLYPNVEAPSFDLTIKYYHGTRTSWQDHILSMFAPTGTIWYTLDGSDPRSPEMPQQPTILVPESADKRVLVPTGSISENWKGGDTFDDSVWTYSSGNPGGIGYERTSGYQDFISFDLLEQMYGKNATCYIRIPFTVDADYTSLTLNVRYDDGFAAYLNGVTVAGRNFSGRPSWDSRATSSHSDSAAVMFESIDISEFLGNLKLGENLLAVHGMNSSTTSSDFLISVELLGTKEDSDYASQGVMEYTGPITLPHSVNVKARVKSGDTWSALNEALYAVGPVTENLRISEIMYNPPEPNEEFIELTNIGSGNINLNLVSFTNGIDFTFPNIALAAGEYVVAVRNRDIFEAMYGTDINIAGQYSGSLNNAGERIELQDAVGNTIHNFRYRDGWRSITDGEGFSLTIIDETNPDVNSWDDKDSWRPSVFAGGSPGTDDKGFLPDPGAIVINEVLAHSHEGTPDWIELHNTTHTLIVIGGWFLSDSSNNLLKYEIPDGTRIGPKDYLVLYEDLNFGNPDDPGAHEPFALSENGERLYLSAAYNGELAGYRSTEDFGASETGVSFGRYFKPSTGNYNFVAMEENTPGSANSYPKVGPIVISEIMYNPDWPNSGSYTNDQYEYIELHNISAEPVTLFRYDKGRPWKFTNGIEFTFPADVPVTIPAGEYILIVKKPAAFSWRYPNVPANIIYGPYEGNLSNAGESLELSMPGDIDSKGERHYIRIDRVNYSDGSHPENCPGGIDLWPVEADGGGMSLTRNVPTDYGNDLDNWLAAPASPAE